MLLCDLFFKVILLCLDLKNLFFYILIKMARTQKKTFPLYLCL